MTFWVLIIFFALASLGSAVFATLTYQSCRRSTKLMEEGWALVFSKLENAALDMCPRCVKLLSEALKEAHAAQDKPNEEVAGAPKG